MKPWSTFRVIARYSFGSLSAYTVIVTVSVLIGCMRADEPRFLGDGSDISRMIRFSSHSESLADVLTGTLRGYFLGDFDIFAGGSAEPVFRA